MPNSTLSCGIISTEIIKPSTPTPSHLKTFNLSVVDRVMTSHYVSLAFFFRATSNSTNALVSDLKTSLSNTLAKYYPFAGRLTNNGATVDCNDEGIDFIEGEMHCHLDEILKNPEYETLNHLFPCKFRGLKPTEATSLVAVQVTSFQCGGITVALKVSHRIADGFSVATFANDWAKVSRGEKINPEFSAMSMEPKEELIVIVYEVDNVNCTSARFVLDSSSLSDLKAKCASSGLSNPTRVESVTTLLYKTAMSAARVRSGMSSNSALHQAVNMRSRISDLPFTENSVGNFTWAFTVFTEKDSEKSLNETTRQLHEQNVILSRRDGERVKFNDWIGGIIQLVKDEPQPYVDVNVYKCSSLCRFPFYEVDYGWGKPLWVEMACRESKNLFMLMDSKDGQGIEALVTLDKEDMEIFKVDKELLTFASLNPSAI